MSPAAQTITTEWTAEKCLDKLVQKTQAKQPNKQMVESALRRCQRQRGLKNNLTIQPTNLVRI